MRSALEHALIVGAPIITLVLLVSYVARHEFAVDFQHQYWVVGHRLLTSGGPYSWTHAQIASGVGAFPYPALSAILFVPFALLPKGLAAAIWVAASMAAVAVTLRVLSVRDWRLYLLVFLWWPVIIGWQTGNMTLLLALGVAVVWRYRDRPLVAGLLTAVLISLKPFLWPLGLWLIASRRYRATASALAGGIAINLIAWGAIGFDQISRYIHLDSAVTTALYHYGYGLIAMAVRLGASRTAGTVVMVLVAVALAVAVLWLGRTRREKAALLMAVVLILAASPLTWNHYLALLIVPLALLRPTLSREWLLPLVLWICPGGLQVAEWQAFLFAAVIAVVCWLLLRREPAAHRAGEAKPSEERRPGQPHVLALAQGGERAG
jgi:hypothetical protein